MGITSTGKLIWLPDTSGRAPVVEQNSSSIKNVGIDGLYRSERAFISAIAAGSVGIPHRLRIGRASMTLSGGVIADVDLVPAMSGYYGVIQAMALTAEAGGSYQLTFQDEDDTDLEGAPGGRIDVEISKAYYPTEIPCMVLSGPADNKKLEVDVAGGIGTETLVLHYLYHYET